MGVEVTWNPWHGCKKLSAGCVNCYVYRMDSRGERDPSAVNKNVSTFRLPVSRNRAGEYKYPSGTVFYTCFTSDFFIEEADEWRVEAWRMIRARSDCNFFIITKRIDRFLRCIPDDWGDGYENVTVAVTVENQDRANYRLPIYISLPIKHKRIICEPLLGYIRLIDFLIPEIEEVSVGGESGEGARECRYEWILDIREQCVLAEVGFSFHQTGANFIKNGRKYSIPRDKQHSQAERAGIRYVP